jgi:hypothetical protein
MDRLRRRFKARSYGGLARGMVPVFLAAALLAGTACGDDDDDDEGNGEEDGSQDFIGELETIDPANFTADITNPFFPQPVGQTRVYEGEDEGTPTRVEETVLEETDEIAGVEVRVVEVNEYEDDELIEHTLDYYAQDLEGNVYYFGETVEDIEDGEVVSNEGEWFAGEGDALPGLFMPAEPAVGQAFRQERAPGVAEDESEILEAGFDFEVPAGSFQDCIKTEDFAPLDDETENKYYCRDVGFVREEQGDEVFLELVEVS